MRRKYFLLLVAFVWILLLQSLPQVRVIGLIGDYMGYRGRSIDFVTVDRAGIAAVLAVNSRSIAENKEFAGKICSKNFQYFYTNPLMGSDMSVTVAKSGLCPIGSKLVADYHTHAASPDNDLGGEIFSFPMKRGDLSNDISTNYYGYHLLWWVVPQHIGYLGTPLGRILKYNPVSGDTYDLIDNSWQVFQKNLSAIFQL